MATEDKYVWTEREQRQKLVVCDDCEVENGLSRLKCENCGSLLIEDEDPNDEFLADRTGRFLSEPPEARDEELGRLLDKVFWFVRNWIWLLLLSVMTLSATIGVLGGLLALLLWEMNGVSIYLAVVLLGVGTGTLVLFDLFNRFGVFEWIYCESAF